MQTAPPTRTQIALRRLMELRKAVLLDALDGVKRELRALPRVGYAAARRPAAGIKAAEDAEKYNGRERAGCPRSQGRKVGR